MHIDLSTVLNFPSKAIHTIKWSMTKYNDMLIDRFSKVIAYIESPPGYIAKYRDSNIRHTIFQYFEYIKEIFQIKASGSFKSCIESVCKLFSEFYIRHIRRLLESYPKDLMIDDYTFFWSRNKRCPHVLEFDPDNEMHMKFVIFGSKIIAENLKIVVDLSDDEIKEFASTIDFTEFESSINYYDGSLTDEQLTTELESILECIDIVHNPYSVSDFQNADCESEAYKLYHAHFIHAASNIRAESYDLKGPDYVS